MAEYILLKSSQIFLSFTFPHNIYIFSLTAFIWSLSKYEFDIEKTAGKRNVVLQKAVDYLTSLVEYDDKYTQIGNFRGVKDNLPNTCTSEF